MSKKFLLSLSYLSLCKFFWTRTQNRVIENRIMENRVKRGITVVNSERIYSYDFEVIVIHIAKYFKNNNRLNN